MRFWHSTIASATRELQSSHHVKTNTPPLLSKLPPSFSTAHVYVLAHLGPTLSVNAKSEDRVRAATSALASFGPNRAMASLEIRPRSKCNPKRTRRPASSRAPAASTGAAAARAAVEAAVGAGGDGVAAGGAATVSAAQASGAFIDDDADDWTGKGLFAASATRCSTRTGGGASGFGRFFTTGGGGAGDNGLALRGPPSCLGHGVGRRHLATQQSVSRTPFFREALRQSSDAGPSQ